MNGKAASAPSTMTVAGAAGALTMPGLLLIPVLIELMPRASESPMLTAPSTMYVLP